MIGKTCGCKACFCCAAALVVEQYMLALKDSDTCSIEELEAAAQFSAGENGKNGGKL